MLRRLIRLPLIPHPPCNLVGAHSDSREGQGNGGCDAGGEAFEESFGAFLLSSGDGLGDEGYGSCEDALSDGFCGGG